MEQPQSQQKQINQQRKLIFLQNIQRTIKKQHRLKIDVSKTQYPLIRNIAHLELGWKVWTKEESKEEINLFWIDTYVHDEFVRKMKPYQRVNHIPGSQNLGKKNQLSSNIARMKKLMPKQYTFYPTTFNFPAQIQDYQKFAKANQQTYYIIKPCSESQGRGIYLTKQPEINSKEELVVQEYIEKPLLIQKCKFDLRIYVLLKSLSPLKIYVYEEGLCRLATLEYQKPQSLNQKNICMHLTNYAINKLSPNFIFNKSEYEDNIGHKRSLSSTFQTLQKMGYNIQVLKLQIDKIIVKTILAVQPLLAKKYRQLRDNRQQNQSFCFQILGFDILVKEDGQPILLEVNHSPSFCTETPLDLLIKKCLVLDTLTLLNLNFEDKINYIKSRNEQDNISSSQIFKSYVKNVVVSSELESIGAYKKIYPVDNVENLQLSKLYQSIIKINKNEKIARITVPKQIHESLLTRGNLQDQHQGLNLQVNLGIDDMIFKNHNQKNRRSLSLYHAINNLKRTKLSQLKNVPQFQNFSNPASFIPESAKKSQLRSQKRSLQFNFEQNNELVKKQGLSLNQRRSKKECQTQKKKYKPLPLANVNIRLDQKYSHKINEDKNMSKISDCEGPFKIHSFIKTSYLGERRRFKEEGHQTARNGGRKNQSLQDKFRITQRSNHFTSYSIELKQKIQRMQLARVRFQKIKKIAKTNVMAINSQLPQQKTLNKALIGQAQ